MRMRTAVLLILVAAALISVGVGVSRRPPAAEEGTFAPVETVGSGPATETAPVDGLALLEVLNGTDEAGLARDVGLVLGSVGATAERFANAPHDSFPASLLVNRTLDPERARELAADLGGLPVLQEYDARSDVEATLVLGADHARVLRALNIRRGDS